MDDRLFDKFIGEGKRNSQRRNVLSEVVHSDPAHHAPELDAAGQWLQKMTSLKLAIVQWIWLGSRFERRTLLYYRVACSLVRRGKRNGAASSPWAICSQFIQRSKLHESRRLICAVRLRLTEFSGINTV